MTISKNAEQRVLTFRYLTGPPLRYLTGLQRPKAFQAFVFGFPYGNLTVRLRGSSGRQVFTCPEADPNPPGGVHGPGWGDGPRTRVELTAALRPPYGKLTADSDGHAGRTPKAPKKATPRGPLS